MLLDPFCGPGRIQVRGEDFSRDGGVVAAWRESVASGAPFTQNLIGDKDPAPVDDSAGRLRALGAPVQSFTGPASYAVPLTVKAVPGQALTLAYVDPYNLELLRFDMFQALASLRVDIAAHFSPKDLNRNVVMEFDPQRGRLDGTVPGWRTHPRAHRRQQKKCALAVFAVLARQGGRARLREQPGHATCASRRRARAVPLGVLCPQ